MGICESTEQRMARERQRWREQEEAFEKEYKAGKKKVPKCVIGKLEDGLLTLSSRDYINKLPHDYSGRREWGTSIGSVTVRGPFRQDNIRVTPEQYEINMEPMVHGENPDLRERNFLSEGKWCTIRGTFAEDMKVPFTVSGCAGYGQTFVSQLKVPSIGDDAATAADVETQTMEDTMGTQRQRFGAQRFELSICASYDMQNLVFSALNLGTHTFTFCFGIEGPDGIEMEKTTIQTEPVRDRVSVIRTHVLES